MKYFSIALIAMALLSSSAFAADKESAYERVLRTGVLRCGYIAYPPHLIVDPATGTISGISHDIIEEAAQVLGFKVEWAEELGWATTVEAMRSGRVDAICTSYWQNPVEGKYVGFTVPTFYSAVGAYVKADNKTIKANLSNVNDPAIKISASDGAISFFTAQQDFPKAMVISHPNMTDETQMLMDVDSGKADITFCETYLGEKFIKANPGSLKNLVPDHPVRLFGNTFAVPMDDYKFKSMLDSALIPMIQGGRIEKILVQYEEFPGGMYRVAKPFEMPH